MLETRMRKREFITMTATFAIGLMLGQDKTEEAEPSLGQNAIRKVYKS